MLIKFAEELKAIRISGNLTLQQVSTKTRIDHKYLEAIESGDFEFLPEIYVKAFLKEYIKALDLDEKAYMKKYESARQGIYQDKEEVPPEEKKISDKEKEPEKQQGTLSSFDAIRQYKRLEEESSASKNRKTKVLSYVTFAAIIIAAVIYLFFFSHEDELIVPEKTWEEVIEETGPENTPVEKPGDIQEENNYTDSLRLTIKAVDTSWIRIVVDDSRSDEFLLFPRSQKVIKAANNYRIVFGNTRGVQLDLNGKPLMFKSASTVQKVKIDGNGISEPEQSIKQE